MIRYSLFFVLLFEVDLPKTPLDTEGPTLQHLGKARPKPARMQRSTRRGGAAPPKKPSVPTEATISEAESEEKPIPEVKPKPKEKVFYLLRLSTLCVYWCFHCYFRKLLNRSFHLNLNQRKRFLQR